MRHIPDPTGGEEVNQQEMHIALCEWMGWKWYRLPQNQMLSDRKYRCLFHPVLFEDAGFPPKGFSVADMTERICNEEYMKKEGQVPPLTLDWLHECENKAIKEGRWADYKNNLWQILVRNPWEGCELYGDDMIHTTKEQRLEALCRTLFPERFVAQPEVMK
jgi:hypothetical protein